MQQPSKPEHKTYWSQKRLIIVNLMIILILLSIIIIISIQSTTSVSQISIVSYDLPLTLSFTPISGSQLRIYSRINFDSGQTTTINGIANQNETIGYVLSATEGQVLSFTLTAPDNEFSIWLEVSGPIEVSELTLTYQILLDADETWSTAVSNSGDYFISITRTPDNSSNPFTLHVSLTTPLKMP